MIRYLSLDPKVPTHAYWDQTLLDDTLKNLPESERDIIVIPGARQADLIDDINDEINQYPKVLVITTSDEESNFPVDKLSHPDMIVYVQYPNKEKHSTVDRYFPIGYPLIEPFPEFTTKKLPWFFAGQVNHESRRELALELKNMSGGKLVESEGFAQGLPKKEYYQNMEYASVVPAPGGPSSPDSFRIYEAMELGAIPIPDHPVFWQMMFGDVPFPTLAGWSELPS